jgi:hypothetical protein|tara:strand:+ start:320 stop:427 length:108 start_codon:yes stop_codon:yes gene_type:complete
MKLEHYLIFIMLGFFGYAVFVRLAILILTGKDING